MNINLKQTDSNNLLNIFKKSIIDFEKSIKNLYDNSSKNNEGYIIDFKNYEEFKNKIFKGDFSNLSEIINKINQIPFKTASYLMNMIYNNNKYIIINKELWKNICLLKTKEEQPITYEIESNDLFLNLDIKLKFYIPNNNNIIVKSSYIDVYFLYYSNFKEISDIYDRITKYYEFEKTFFNELKKGNKTSYGYLVDKIWIDEWKEFTNYEYIKKKYLENNLEENIIKNEIIYYREEKKNNLQKLKPVEIFEIKNKNEFKSLLTNKTLIILDYSFLMHFIQSLSISKSIDYKFHNNELEFFFGDRSKLVINTNSNVISLNKSNDLPNLYQLIKIFYFEKDLQKIIYLPYEQLKYNRNIPEHLYLINKKIMDKYKLYFNGDILYDFLRKYDKTEEIKYNDLSKHFLKIAKILKETNENYYNFLKDKEKNFLSELKYNSNDCDFNVNILDYKENKTLYYIRDIKIIDEDILSFFIENGIIPNDKKTISKYIMGDGKILIAFSYDDYNYYEIGSIDKSNDFIIEYLLKDRNHYYQEKIISYFKFINGIKKFMEAIFHNTNNNEILFNGSSIGYYYKFKENEEKFPKEKYPMDNIFNEEDEYTEDILFFLLSLFLSEMKIKKKITNSENQSKSNNSTNCYKKLNTKQKCYLINSNYLNKIKTLFSYHKIINFIEKNQINLYNIDKNILQSKKDDEYFKLISIKKKDLEKNNDN